MNWKIKRDPFYGELFQTIGLSGIEEAGYFADSSSEDEDLSKSVRILCTPLAFMLPALSNAKRPAIILTTGSFDPLHHGHLQMMENAKSYLDNIGYNVVGGFISPGHDEYISAKNKEKAAPIHYRIRNISEMTKDIDWISVDPWEGLFCKVAVNFTDVYTRLSMYVKEHLKMDIPIFFVSGGDNARFALTFTEGRGNCIIVNRPPYEDRFEKYRKMLSNYENLNIHFVDGNAWASSTERRKTAFVPDDKKKLTVRIENDKYEEVVRHLKKHYLGVDKRYLSDQQAQFDVKFFNSSLNEFQKTISMDPLLETEINVQISRNYDIFGSKILGFTNRPGSPSLLIQALDIKRGSYILFDDDIHTGGTMRYVKDLVEATGSKISEITTLNLSSPENTEILDCRDFFLDDKLNGLVLKLPNGENARAPYVYPYVCPFVRASIGDPMQFSIAVWRLNMELFADNFDTLENSPFKDLFLHAGFKPEDSMYDICRWHHRMLKEKAGLL
jgi:cytidyltransferase-like protein